MDDEGVLDAILSPDAANIPILLDRLGLGGLPSQEDVHAAIEQKLLLPKDQLPAHWLPAYQIRWQPELSIPSLLSSQPTPAPTTLAFTRAGLGGRVVGYSEVPNPRIDTGLQSTSLDRAPGPSKNFVRGKSGYVPFWPGGLDAAARDYGGVDALVSGGKGLRTLPPGFSRGLRLPGEVAEDEFVDFASGSTGRIHGSAEGVHGGVRNDADIDGLMSGTSDIDNLLPVSRSNLNPVSAARPIRRAQIQKRDWAHVVDINKKMTNFHELVPDMAHKYPFELDTFQKEAVYHLEMGDSVFVAAHTSAGKTVVAEYAIALAQKHMTRAIYTSPIKALSNQKFRDFKQTFSATSVGILTGDVQINPEANCLIMTTEILRSMLYKGADLIRDVEFVIFDEVHYVNDAERGVVWEEVIIMLPEHVSIILLSATVPNTKEFADWVGRTKKKDIYVISTAQRPIPLEHYVYAGRDVHKIVDAKGAWQADGYKNAKEALRRKQDKEREAAGLPPVQKLGARAGAPQRGTQRGGQRGGAPAPRGRGTTAAVAGGGNRFHQADKNVYVHLMGHLKKKSLLPVVVFTFSKKKCEEYAATLINSDLSTAAEKSEVHVAVERALGRLKGTDKKLPQIARMRDLLSRGIGVHHGGLLPIVKEVVELLFARGLVKVLFATETFAMGVNMPAKCVVFSNIRKHDGRSFRDILPGEYTQMAGRAGRRGLDATGTVIINANDDLPEQDTLTTMLLGKPTKLQSQFRLTYNMILNLLRVEALKVEEMIKRSFSENASQRLLPDQQQKVVEGEKRLAILPKLQCDVCSPDIDVYYDTNAEVAERNLQLLTMVTNHRESKNILVSGRVVVLRDEHFDHNLAVVLRGAAESLSTEGVRDKIKSYFVLALVDEDRKSGKNDIDPLAVTPRWPPRVDQLVINVPVYELRQIPLTSIAFVTNRTMKVDVHSIVDRHMIASMNEVISNLAALSLEWASTGTIPEVEWLKMRSLDFQETLRSRDRLVQRLSTVACTMCADFEDHYAILHTEKILRSNVANLKMAISDQNLELIPDYEQRIEVLQDLQFIDDNSTVLLKGRVACEINSANELVLTELILENTLAAYTPEEVVALLSCFVFQEKTDVEPKVPEKLEQGRASLIAISDRVEAVQTARKVAASEFRTMKFGLMEVVYEWAKGMPFEQIATLTDVAEGTIVRVITRLDETCREVRDAARVIGDADLMKKMEEAQGKIRRDIVFAASLYF